MREWHGENISIIGDTRSFASGIPSSFSVSGSHAPKRFHKMLASYNITPLVSLSELAKRLGVKQICVKDESKRFGLNAFKGLGGSYAMFRILCEKLGLDHDSAGPQDILADKYKEKRARLEFVTCTDGNHGKGVSWAAGLFGCRAHVFMPAGTRQVRADAIRNAGPADVMITDLCYDDTVRYAEKMSEKNGWILIQDTSWDGYEKIPTWIIQGYLTIVSEAAEQLAGTGMRPTHVFLQAGVGAMAGGVLAYLKDLYGEKEIVSAVVEPYAANCVYASAMAQDGMTHSVESSAQTMMAGLNCGTPCGVAWPVLRDHADYYISCDDIVAARGMRSYASGEGSDPVIISGESGGAPLGALECIMTDDKLGDLRDAMGLGSDSVILLINTEGDTDPENYRRITGEIL